MRRLWIAATLSVALVGPALADAKSDLKAAKSALDTGDYRGAMTALNSVIAASPKSAEALGLRCQINLIGGNVADAQVDLGAALKANANLGAVQICQASIHLRQRKFADAVTAYDRAIKAGETGMEVRSNRALALAMAGKPQDAVAAFDRVIAEGASAPPAQRAQWLADRARLHASLGNSERALKDLDDSLNLAPTAPEATERRFLRARARGQAGQYDAALADLNELIGVEQGAMDPRKALLFATRGSTYAAKGEFTKAIADLDGAIAIGKDVPPNVVGSWYVIRARANRAAGRPDAAIQDYSAALRVTPDDVDTLGERGELMLLQGRTDDAIADFQAAVLKSPNNPAPHSWLGWGFAEKGNYDQAIQSASKVVDLRPREPIGYWDRGVFKFLQGRFGEATADLDQAVLRSPQSASAVLLAYIARTRAGDKRVELLTDRARALDPKNWPTPLTRLFLGEASPDDVMKGQQKPTAETLFYVGQYHLLAGHPDKAAELFRRAVDTKEQRSLEHMAAKVELARLRG